MKFKRKKKNIFKFYNFLIFFISWGRRWMKNLICWRYFASYFPVNLIKTQEIDSSKNAIFCSFPHGVLATGVMSSFTNNALNSHGLFPGFDFKCATVDLNFWCPFAREFFYLLGISQSNNIYLQNCVLLIL